MKDSRVLEQRAKIELIPDDSLKQFMPIRVAIFEVSLADGRVFTQRIDSVRGTPRNPMTEQEIVFKANDLIAPVLGDKQAGKLIEAVLHLEKLGNIKGLSLLLQKNSHV
jgi:2-methylcitrate dehydratase PrpD